MRQQITVTPEARRLWDRYAIAKVQAEDSLLLKDGRAAAEAFYDFVEAFAPQAMGPNVIPFQLRRRQRDLA